MSRRESLKVYVSPEGEALVAHSMLMFHPEAVAQAAEEHGSLTAISVTRRGRGDWPGEFKRLYRITNGIDESHAESGWRSLTY